MGFENRTFEENEIKSYQIDKWSGVATNKVFTPKHGTIDTERNIRLLTYSTEIRDYENINDEKDFNFVFDWKGKIVLLTMARIWGKDHVLTWGIYNRHLLFLSNEIMAVLRDAIKTFKYEGWSKFPDTWQKSEDVELKINF